MNYLNLPYEIRKVFFARVLLQGCICYTDHQQTSKEREALLTKYNQKICQKHDLRLENCQRLVGSLDKFSLPTAFGKVEAVYFYDNYKNNEYFISLRENGRSQNLKVISYDEDNKRRCLYKLVKKCTDMIYKILCRYDEEVLSDYLPDVDSMKSALLEINAFAFALKRIGIAKICKSMDGPCRCSSQHFAHIKKDLRKLLSMNLEYYLIHKTLLICVNTLAYPIKKKDIY